MKELNLRAMMIKPLEGSIDVNLCDFGLGEGFSNVMSKA
jgi:hypothetical protein